jgi:hypothetical protein
VTAWVAITDAPTSIEIAWRAAKLGTATLLVNGSPTTLSGIDTSAYAIGVVWLGPSAGLARGMSGRVVFDRFVSDRTTPIGP